MIYEKKHIELFEGSFGIKESDFASENEYASAVCERTVGFSRTVIDGLPNVKTEIDEMYELFALLKELKSDERWGLFVKWIRETERFDFSMHPVHGFPHTARCGFYQFAMGIKLGVDEKTLRLMVLAGLYHDIGRTDDEFDVVHGKAAALMLPSLFPELSKDELSILQAAVHTHCFPEPYDESMWYEYIDERLTDECRFVAESLRAADSLDYMRLGISGYDDKYLHSDTARKMILCAFEANLLFAKFPEIYKKVFLQR